MKRVVSLILSVVMLLSSIICVDLPAFAEDDETFVEIVEIGAEIDQLSSFGYYNGHTYQVRTEKFSTWKEAQSFCENMGGHLAIISDAEEDDAVYNILKDSGKDTAFLGMYEIENGKWVDVYGNDLTYFNWGNGEPNNKSSNGKDENIIQYWKDQPTGKWNDFCWGDIGVYDFICEWDYCNNLCPTMSEESSIEFLRFILNDSLRSDDFYKGLDYFKVLTGNFNGSNEDYQATAIALSLFTRTMLNKQITNAQYQIDKSYEFALEYFTNTLGNLDDLPEEIINEYMNDASKKIAEGLTDLMVYTTSNTTGIYITEDHLEWIYAVQNGYIKAQKTVDMIGEYIDYLNLIVCGFGYMLAAECKGRYEYFASYLDGLHAWDGQVYDQAFKVFDDWNYNALAGDNAGVAFIIDALDTVTHHGKSWIHYRTTIQRWAKCIYLLEKSVIMNENNSADNNDSACEHIFNFKKVLPTCTDDGYTIGICTKCGFEQYSDWVFCNGHNYSSETYIAPTCTENGYDKYICQDCHAVEKINIKLALGHNYNFTKTVSPTCTAQGYDLYTCTQCSSTEKQNTVSATGHNYNFTKTVSPTCTAQGYDLYTCTQCSSTEKRNTVSATGHNYTFTKTVDPTCTVQGYDLYTCSVCNSTEKRNTVSSTGHNYEETNNTATCTEKGIKTTVCSKCGDTKTTEVSSLGHSYSKVYTNPTCTKDGGYTNTCTRCGDITYNTYSALGHDYGECIGQDYIDKISSTSISATPNYFNEFYHTSSSIGSTSQVAFSSTNIAVPNEIRLDINNISEVTNYQFAVYGGLFSRKTCTGIFAYDKSTGRSPEQSAIPYTDKDGNLVDFTYIDYKVNGVWKRGHYNLNDNNEIIDTDGNIVCSDFEQTRTHIHYTKQEALDLGFMNSDGTVNAADIFEKYEGVWFSAGIPGVYFKASNITSSSSRRFIDVFGYDESANDSIKAGKYDVDICFYNQSHSGLASTVFKIYDQNELITKTPATSSIDEKVMYTCIDCGETHTDTCKLNIADFKIKTVSLSLESSITMNFKVLKSAVADFENPYVVFNCEGDELKVTDYTEQGDYYVFSYPSISPQLMNDNVVAVLHAEHNGIEYTSPEKVMSVRTYAYTMLDRYNTDDYAELRTLLVDLLNYGAASQNYVGYQTDNLVNEDLTYEQKSWGTSTTPVFENIRDYNYKTIDNPTSKWVGSGLVLNNSVMVRAKFSADSIDNKTVVITCGKGTFTYSKDDFVQDKDGNYYVYCNEIFANEMSEEILLTVYDNGVACSNTMRFSIESYAKLVHDSYQGTALDELTTAMMRYGNSAKAYGA